jgi:Na+-transporting NADH:ubiquinone oxidoreductase subunit NqrC
LSQFQIIVTITCQHDINMTDLPTLQRVVDELKRKKGLNRKDLSAKTGIDYIYLTKQISGASKLTESSYSTIMNYARQMGIDTTVFKTRSTAINEVITPPVVQGLSGTINVSIKLDNNKITGIDWHMTAL